MQAYFQRKDNLAKMAENDDVGKPDKKPERFTVPMAEFAKVIASVDGDGLSFHTFEDIGRYTVFPEKHWKRMFPSASIGNFDKDEYENNQTYGIMTREEGLRITNELARLTLPEERKFDFTKLLSYGNVEIKQEVL